MEYTWLMIYLAKSTHLKIEAKFLWILYANFKDGINQFVLINCR